MLQILLWLFLACLLLTFADCAVGWWGRKVFRSDVTVNRLQGVFGLGGMLTGGAFTIMGIVMLLHWVWGAILGR